jgi:hypothetical protein
MSGAINKRNVTISSLNLISAFLYRLNSNLFFQKAASKSGLNGCFIPQCPTCVRNVIIMDLISYIYCEFIPYFVSLFAKDELFLNTSEYGNPHTPLIGKSIAVYS